LHWVIENKSGSKNIDHYLDDFLFGGEKGTNECKNLMLQFEKNCSEISVPIANEKTEHIDLPIIVTITVNTT
jgi:hypothetical protein